MYDRLSIHGLRGIDALEVNDLKRVNLIVGKNGSGKSSLLEALAMLGAATNPVAPAVAASLRLPRYDAHLTLASLYPSMDASRPIEVEAHWGQEPKPRRLRVAAQQLATIEIGRDTGPGETGPKPIAELRLTYTPASGGDIQTSARIEGARVTGNPMRRPDEHPVAHLNRAAGTEDVDATVYSQLVQQKREQAVTEGVRALEPKILRVALVSNLGRPVLVVDLGLPALLPIAAMGDGFSRLFGILVAELACQDGVLLIDELESGLHHSLFQTLWEIVDSISRQHNVQVFATTHSDELLTSALQHFDSTEEKDFAVFRMDRQPDGRRTVVSYGPELQPAILREGFEVRG